MSRGKSKNKRKINEGLRRYNQVRSYLSKESKRLGGKYNNVELNSLTKSFLLENFGKSFTDEEIGLYVKDTVIGFDLSAVESLSFAKILSDFDYYLIDEKIKSLPKDIYVSVDAGQFGNDFFFYDSHYNYTKTNLPKIVEDIREVNSKDGEDKSGIYTFTGQVLKKKKDNKHVVKYTLRRNGELIGSGGKEESIITIGKFYVTKPKSLKQRTKEREIKKIKKESSQVEINKQIQLEKEKQKTLKLQNKKIKEIQKLLSLGFTKAEIKKAGLL